MSSCYMITPIPKITDKDSSLPMDRLRPFGLLWLLLAFSTLCSPAFSNEDQDWTLVSDRNDIQVYMKHRDESRLKTFRGVTRFPLKDEYSLVALLNDYPSYPKWLHFVDSAEEFGRANPLDRQLRFTTQLPWPLADREAVLRAKVTQVLDPNPNSVKITLINQPDALPPTKNYIRFPEMTGILAFSRLSNHQIEMTYELILDPGGYIPAWIANILLRDAPYFTLERLRRIINKPEYQNHYYDYIELNGPGRLVDATPQAAPAPH
ncbi:START domain-containing protein [Alcanivorax sp.]|uniref:START domain-containing protein n=2 Tax=Alcanivorax TaxID=59753 RepID=UPI002588A472|nr:START domain-containing protein [Alcanivorax sp.]